MCQDVRCGSPECGGNGRDESLRPSRLTTPLRTTALHTYRKRFRSAFGRYRSRAKSLRHDRRVDPPPHGPAAPTATPNEPFRTFLAGRRGGDFLESVTRANTCAAMRRDSILSRAGSLIWPDANFLLRRGCARVRKPNTPSVSAPLTVPSLTSRRIAPCFRTDVPDPTYRPAPGRRIADCRCVRRRDETWGFGRFSRTCEHLRRTRADIGCLRRGDSLILGDANWLQRQQCARMRKPSTQSASAPISAAIALEAEHRVVGLPRSPLHRVPTRIETLNFRSP